MTRLVSLLALALSIPVAAQAAPVDFTTPKGWKKEEPKSKMRKHQFHIPRAEGDTRDGKLIVYYFGAMGGGNLDDNIKRWASQVKPAEGDPEAKQSKRTCGGLKVIIYDQVGTYTPPVFRPNAPKAKPQPGTRIINAMIETGEGNYFLKLIGPKKTIDANEKPFYAFLDSAKPTGKAKPAKPSSRPASKPASQPN